VGIPIATLSDYEVISKNLIADSVRRLEVISCDICKSAAASYDVFVKSVVGVAFLKRCCEQCVESLGSVR
jgi:hypothetical protein